MRPIQVVTVVQSSRASTRELQRRYFGIAVQKAGYPVERLPAFSENPVPSSATEDLLRELIDEMLTTEVCDALTRVERLNSAREARRIVRSLNELSLPWGSVDQAVEERIRSASTALPEGEVSDHVLDEFILLCALADQFSDDLTGA